MKRLVGRTGTQGLELEAARGRMLVEESREMMIVLDADGRVVAMSRRARQAIPGLEEGKHPPEDILGSGARVPSAVTYDVAGRQETILYLTAPGEVAAYEELRAGFTAAVSHELRTPLARIMALLESAELPGMDTGELVEQARGEVDQIRELIDDVLFLSELETGREVVALGSAPAVPILREVVESLSERAARAGVTVSVVGNEDVELPLRPRMLKVIGENLEANALRYAGPGATFTLAVERLDGTIRLTGSDDGIGVQETDLPRLFERFYRGDRARASRGTGLGLAIVKHIVTQAGGTVDATGARGKGLTVHCLFPADA